MKIQYDVIIIGAGHNGLVTAALLAKAGKKVLVLEKRGILGGLAATEEIFPGYQFNTGASDSGMFRPEIIKALDMTRYGLKFINAPVEVFNSQGENNSLTLWASNINQSIEDIKKHSDKDADRYENYLNLAGKFSRIIQKAVLKTPPDLFNLKIRDALNWGPLAISARMLGGKKMMRLLRSLPMTAKEFLDEWFDSDILKATLGGPSVTGSMQGPQSAGTTFMLLYQQIGKLNGGYRSAAILKGGIGQLSNILAEIAQKHAAEIRVNAGVKNIIVENSAVKGVITDNGEEIFA
ncbi:MAG: NAD(P)/FAD-dependent oxidoreductase, partial [Chloroflexota bacterium]